MALSKQWRDHIAAWQGSGLKQSAYCRQHGLDGLSAVVQQSLEHSPCAGPLSFATVPVTACACC